MPQDNLNNSMSLLVPTQVARQSSSVVTGRARSCWMRCWGTATAATSSAESAMVRAAACKPPVHDERARFHYFALVKRLRHDGARSGLPHVVEQGGQPGGAGRAVECGDSRAQHHGVAVQPQADVAQRLGQEHDERLSQPHTTLHPLMVGSMLPGVPYHGAVGQRRLDTQVGEHPLVVGAEVEAIGRVAEEFALLAKRKVERAHR